MLYFAVSFGSAVSGIEIAAMTPIGMLSNPANKPLSSKNIACVPPVRLFDAVGHVPGKTAMLQFDVNTVLTVCSFIGMFELLLNVDDKRKIADRVARVVALSGRYQIVDASRATGDVLATLVPLSLDGLKRLVVIIALLSLGLLIVAHWFFPLWRLSVASVLQGQVSIILVITVLVLTISTAVLAAFCTSYLLPILRHARGWLAPPIFVWAALTLALLMQVIVKTPAYFVAIAIDQQWGWRIPIEITLYSVAEPRTKPTHIRIRRLITQQEKAILSRLKKIDMALLTGSDTGPLASFRSVINVVSASEDDLFFELTGTSDFGPMCGKDFRELVLRWLSVSSDSIVVEDGNTIDCRLLQYAPLSHRTAIAFVKGVDWVRFRFGVNFYTGHFAFRESSHTDGVAIVGDVYIKRFIEDINREEFANIKKLFDKRQFDPLFNSIVSVDGVTLPISHVAFIMPLASIGIFIFFIAARGGAFFLGGLSQTWLYSRMRRAPLVAVAGFLALASMPVLLIKSLLF